MSAPTHYFVRRQAVFCGRKLYYGKRFPFWQSLLKTGATEAENSSDIVYKGG